MMVLRNAALYFIAVSYAMTAHAKGKHNHTYFKNNSASIDTQATAMFNTKICLQYY